jgi:CBS domain-containing protein
MTVQEIMTTNVACCAPDTRLNQVARMMVEHDCGEIPVADTAGKVVGVVTDRDICCRAVAHDCNPCDISAAEIMSAPVVTAHAAMSLERCAQLMEENQIRRIPVVDEKGVCYGIVSQADIACKSSGKVEEIVREISQPTHSPSSVGGWA